MKIFHSLDSKNTMKIHRTRKFFAAAVKVAHGDYVIDADNLAKNMGRKEFFCVLIILLVHA